MLRGMRMPATADPPPPPEPEEEEEAQLVHVEQVQLEQRLGQQPAQDPVPHCQSPGEPVQVWRRRPPFS